MRMRSVFLPALALLACACASKAPPEPEEAARPAPEAQARAVPGDAPSWTGTVDAGSQVSVHGINGSIRVTAAEGDELRVDAARSGRDAEEVRLVVVQTGDRVVVCTVFPGGQCDADGYRGSHGGRHRVDAQMDLELRLPADVNLTARTVNGSIETTGVTGAQAVRTVNGNLDVVAGSTVSAETVNGAVSAGLARVTGDVRLKSVNGGVRLELGDSASADISAQCVSGNIRSDLPLAHEKRIVGARATGTVGGGGARVRLETVNGSIEIERSEHAAAVPVRAVPVRGGTSAQGSTEDPFAAWGQTLRTGLVI